MRRVVLGARRRALFRDERGVTTVGMAVAILVSLSLLFTTAQVYRVNAACAEIQEVADAAALAAQNEVAEFMVAVRVCDAAVLSMTLLSVSAYGLGVVALCVPAGAGVGEQLVELGAKVADARDAFARKAAAGLNALQKALPFLAAANAASVAAANNAAGAQAGYFAVAVLVPSEGDDIVVGDAQGASELEDAVNGSSQDIREAAERAEEAASAANEAKLRAFESDCGVAPSPCMYERAGRLASLSSSDNPLYHSVDAWSFSVALKRVRAYYAARLVSEQPASESTYDQVKSAMRKRFYAYAVDELARAYVVDESDVFEAYFPHLFRNTEQMRETSLYDEQVYPISEQGEARSMHAYAGCPNAQGAVELGSIRELEQGAFEICELCGFAASSLGNVASASTSINNGFEYHYEQFVQAVEDYQRARDELSPKTAEVKGLAGDLLDTCAQVAGSASSLRISASPPGSNGVVALVVNMDASAADAGFESAFVRGGMTLGARAAVSGATLVADSSHDGSSVITSLLDGFGQDAGAAVGAARVVLECWSELLGAYARGQDALVEGARVALDSLPLASGSGLGTWAAEKLQDALGVCGLEPAQLDALKPVLVNTSRVTADGQDAFSVRYAQVKQYALSTSSSSGNVFEGLVDSVEADALDALEVAEDGVVVALIDFPVGNVSIPVTVALPSAMADDARSFVDQAADQVRSLVGEVAGVRVWS